MSGAIQAADMSVATIGAVDYAKALDGLSLKQAQLMLTTQGIVGEEQKDLLVKQGLIATSDRMSASLVAEALADNGLDKELQDSILIKAQLMNQDSKLLITENAITEAKLRAILAEKGIKGAKADTLIASILQTGQNTKEAISWDVLTASIWANIKALATWFVSSPVGWILMATGAVVGFIKVVDHFAITAEKLNDQLQELKATEEELISAQDKLTEIDNKIAEIQSKGTLSITDNADISRLEQEKLLLKDEIELLEKRKELQQDEYNKNAKKYADGEYSNYTHGQGDITHLMNSYKGYKAKSERTDIDDYFIEDAKKGLKETEAELIEYRNTINENLANLAPDDEESRKKLESIREAIEKLIYTEEELAKIKFDRFIIDPNNTGISEGFEKIKSDGEVTTQEITELANKFPTLKKFMDDNGISAETLAAELNNVGTEAENSGGNVNKMTVSLSELEGASDKIKTLGSAFKELSDDGYITTKTLGEIQTATGLSGNKWAEYEDKLLNAKTGSAEFNRVMGELTYAILENQLGTEKLANADEDYIEAILRENGVLNANGVAHDMIERAKIANQAKTIDLANAIEDGSIIALKNEALQCGYTESAFWSLVAQEKIFNNTSLDVTQQISALKSLEIQAGITKGALSGLSGGNSIGDKLNDAYSLGVKANEKGNIEFNGRDYGRGQDAYNQAIADATAVAFQKDLESKFKDVETKFTDGVNYSGDSKSDSGSDKNKPDYEDPTEAIINRINLRSKELEKQEQSIEDALEVAEIEKDYEKQISLTNDLITTRKKRVDELNKANAGLHNEAEYQRSIHTFYNEDGTESDENLWFDSQGSATEYYNALLNKTGITKEEQEAIRDLFEKLSKYKEAYRDNAEEVVGLNKEILEDEKNVLDLRWDNSNNWIDERNHYNDWHLFDDSEVEAWERVVKWLREDYPNDLDKIKEAERNLFDARKKQTEDFLNEIQTKLDKSYDIRISRLNSESSLLSAHYGVFNAINEEQHNLNKELLEAETIGARMNEQERETLFTKKEHTRLSGKLNDIMLDISDLQSDYQQALDTATSDTIEEITNHYERQYELKMKEYEIVRAELDLMRKRQILENVENEKSVRTWNGSSWVYESNLQDFLDAQEEVANAKYELTRAKTEEAQQNDINALNSEADTLQTEKNRLTSAIEDMAEKMEGSGKKITGMLQTIAETDLPTFDAIIQSFGDTLKNTFGISDESIHYYRLGGSYATGTQNASKGLGLFDEDGLGSEFILTKDGVLTQFQGGEHVFSPEMADRLWEMAQQNYNFAPTVVQPDFGRLVSVDDKISNAINNISNAFGDTYMIKDVQLNESEGGTLKGFINFLKKKI